MTLANVLMRQLAAALRDHFGDRPQATAVASERQAAYALSTLAGIVFDAGSRSGAEIRKLTADKCVVLLNEWPCVIRTLESHVKVSTVLFIEMPCDTDSLDSAVEWRNDCNDHGGWAWTIDRGRACMLYSSVMSRDAVTAELMKCALEHMADEAKRMKSALCGCGFVVE